jgi:hypothetical protein
MRALEYPWYVKRARTKESKGYEWYLFSPFWKIYLFHQDEIDITSIKTPSIEELNAIIDNAQRVIKKREFKEMNGYIKEIIRLLKEFQENSTS